MAELKKLPFPLPPPRAGGVDLLIIAGEHSGDQHAARMVGELLAKQPGLKICAIGGPRLATRARSCCTILRRRRSSATSKC